MRHRARTGARGWASLLALLPFSACTLEYTDGPDTLTLGIGLGMFVVFNVLYYVWRREDHPGEIRRALAFMGGLPLTFLTFLLVEPDADAAWRRLTREDQRDDPERVEADFRRELERVRRMRRIEDPEGGAA